MSAPPGWYPDPEWMGRERYWDGHSWTSRSRRYQSRARRRGSSGAAPREGASSEGAPPPDHEGPPAADRPSPHDLPARLTPPDTDQD